MDVNLIERDFIHVVQPGQHHPRDPQRDDVTRGDQRAGRIEGLELFGFVGPTEC